MYGNALTEATLKAGHTYRVTGRYADTYLGRYAIVDVNSGEPVTEYIDVEFTLVEHKALLIIPVIIK